LLGELIFESKGKIIGQRVLSVESAVPKLELSVKGTGTFNESTEVTDIGPIGICKDLMVLHMEKDEAFC
jgi:hypothetical protein